jgi:50S ribosomal protein L16 3-hydroxylase
MPLLGTLTPERFLREHWQKRPLLVRGALPGFLGLLSPPELFRLAGRDDVVARAVTEAKGERGPRWRLQEGPFRKLDLASSRKDRFTLLVQGLEAHLEGAWDLLSRFSFVPWARIDDLMVSYAAPGGSVGPHFDAYDVFLLQGEGRRRWQISETTDLEIDTDEEVQVLRRFSPTEEWVLEPGDMLYLPPYVGHWGTAVDACMTYSIGFVAPSHEQLVHNFLGFLGEEVGEPEGMYEDADLQPQAHAGELGDAMVQRVARTLEQLRWNEERVGVFLGRLLTAPKPYTPPPRPGRLLDAGAFARALSVEGRLSLAPSTRLLFRGDDFFVDGDRLRVEDEGAAAVLQTLADQRFIMLPVEVGPAGHPPLFALYRKGRILL